MLFWIFVIAVGSTIGVLLGGGILLWLFKHDLSVFDVVRTLLLLLAVILVVGFLFFWWMR